MSKMLCVISEKQLKDAGHGKFTVTYANPVEVEYAGLPAVGTTLPGAHGSDVVLSVQPGGDLECRPAGTAGGYEQCTKSQGLLVFSPVLERVFVVPFAKFGA